MSKRSNGSRWYGGSSATRRVWVCSTLKPCVVLALHLVVPARWVDGYVVDPATGRKLRYRLNGLRVMILVVAAWAIAIWASLFGSLSLLLRKAWAVWLFGAAIAGMAISTLYNFVLSNGLEMMGTTGAVFTAVIWVIALLVFFYARAMARRGVLM